jgi:undecaprenyl-diphosphatase
MEWNGLFGLIYGLLSGFFEFLPVSPQIHQLVFGKIAGLDEPGYGLSLAVHLGALAAVILSYYPKLSKFSRERKIAAQPMRRRKRQPDVVSLMEWRLLRIASVPVILACLLASWLGRYMEKLWLLAIFAALNGVLILLPQYLSRANKDARSLSPLDATLAGLGGFLSILPGISKVGMVTSVASMRGADRQFGLNFAYLLMIPALTALSVGDIGMMIFAESASSVPFFTGVLACIASFAAAFGGIQLMRFLVQKDTLEGFACYNWGIAMFAFIIYLIG